MTQLFYPHIFGEQLDDPLKFFRISIALAYTDWFGEEEAVAYLLRHGVSEHHANRIISGSGAARTKSTLESKLWTIERDDDGPIEYS